MSADSVAQDQIVAYVERILRMKEERKAIDSDIRDIYAEAKGNGFDKTVLGKLVNYIEKRQTDNAALSEAEAIFELYLTAYDSAQGRLGTRHATHTHEADRSVAKSTTPNPSVYAPVAHDVDETDTNPEITEPAEILAGGNAGAAPALPAAPATNPEANVEEEANGRAVTSDDAASREVDDADRQQFVASGLTGDGEAASTVLPTRLRQPGEEWSESHPRYPVPRHPLNACFPELLGYQFSDLVEDIVEHGQQKPIIMLKGACLDGWARYNAARKKGMLYHLQEYWGEDPLADLISSQMASRTFTPKELKGIAQKLISVEPDRAGDILTMLDLDELAA